MITKGDVREKSFWVKRAHLLLLITVVLTSCFLSSYFFYLSRAVITIPYWDQLSWMREYLETDDFFGFIWGQYVSHRNVFSKLLCGLDIMVFRGSIAGMVVLQQIFWVSMVGVFCYHVMKMKSDRLWLAMVLMILTFLSFSASNYVFTAYPINVSFLFVTGFALFAFASNMSEGNWFYLTPLFAFFSQISSINGILVWPLAVIMHHVRFKSLHHTLFLLITGLLFNFLFFIDFTFYSSDSSRAGFDLIQALTYFLQIQGLPWSLAGKLHIGFFAGVILTIGQITAVIHFSSNKSDDASRFISVSCILFSLATCALIAYGRYDNTPRVGGRYFIFPILSWLSLVVYAAPLLYKIVKRKSAERFCLVSVFILSVVSLCMQVLFGNYYSNRSRKYHELSKMAAGGKKNAEVMQSIYPEAQEIDSIYTLMEKNRIYIYRK